MTSTSITLGQALAEYLQSLKPEMRRTQEAPVRRFVEYFTEARQLSSITGAHIERYAELEIQATDPAGGDRVQALKAWFVFLKKKEFVEANLGIHIRTRRVQSIRSGGVRPQDAPIEMTRNGYEALQAELENLDEQRNEQRREVEVARSDGDLRENAPYHAAREKLALLDSQFRKTEEVLRRATIVDQAATDRASVGSIVTVMNLDDAKSFEYRLVSPREANATERKISVESPVGKELLGKSTGDEVVVTTPRGQVRFRVEAVASS